MKNYLTKTKEELFKINWPTKQTVLWVTVAVIVISVVVGYILGLFDALFAKGLLYILSK